MFKELLRHMQDNKIYKVNKTILRQVWQYLFLKVKAVVWNVMPQPRMDANLQVGKVIQIQSCFNSPRLIWLFN